MSDTSNVDFFGADALGAQPAPFGTDALGNPFTADAAPADLFGTNLNSGGDSAVAPVDLSTNPDFGSLSQQSQIAGVGGGDPGLGPPASKPDVPSSSPSWVSQALSSLGAVSSAVTQWARSPFQTAIDNRTGTTSVITRGSQSPLQSRLLSLFGSGSPASGGAAPIGGGVGGSGSSLILYGGLAFLLFALVKR